MEIKVLELVQGCVPVRVNGYKSDCFDLFLSEDVTIKKGEVYTACLGIAIELPKGMIARVYSRSSLPVKLSVTMANCVGFIDNSYKSEDDEWKLPLYAFKNTTIKAGTRVCQFEVCPSQFATIWQKLKWLLSGPMKIKIVKSLNNSTRGGIGSSGN